MARPKKDEINQRTHNVMVRLSDEEYRYLENVSALTKRAKAVYLRDCFLGTKPSIIEHTTVDLPQVQELVQQFSRIGNNLNQVAKYLNEGNPQDKAIRLEINHCLTDLNMMTNNCNNLIMGFLKAGEQDGNIETHSEQKF